MVAWGLHTPEEKSFTEHSLYQKGMTTDDFLSVYIPACQEMELSF